MTSPLKVLILCTGNSCRSQMAEELWNTVGAGDWSCYSAGSRPAGYVHEMAVQAMQELEIDLSSNESKRLDVFADVTFDYAITVCDHADQACPVISNARQRLHWPFPDPADATGSKEEQLAVFRTVRDAISDRIRQFLEKCQPSTGDA
ncbi:MAG: arsenate reductase ArsC [Planctomycetota bacterium]|nr:arsenate reductase ArsC [Planctomycetota bacterium]